MSLRRTDKDMMDKIFTKKVDDLETTAADTARQLADTDERKADKTEVRLKSVKNELEDLSPTVLAAIEGSPEGEKFNLLSIPQDSSVTPSKTTFIKTSTNKFNKNSVARNTSIDLSGTVVESLNYITSDYIGVSEGDYMARHVYYFSLFDENKDFVKRVNVNESGRESFNLIIEPDIHFVRLTTNTLVYSIDTVQLNKGAVLLPYEPFINPYLSEEINVKVGSKAVGTDNIIDKSVTVDKISFIKKSTNLFDKSRITESKRLDTTDGVMVDSLSANVSDFIHLDNGVQYTSKNLGVRVLFYDSSKHYIGYEETTTFIFPNDAKYARFSFRKEDTDTAQLNKGSTPLEYESFQEYIDPTLIKVGKLELENQSVGTDVIADKAITVDKLSFMKKSTNLFDKSKITENKRLDIDSGEMVDSLSTNVSPFIPLINGVQYTFKNLGIRVYFYDSSKQFIKYEGVNTFTLPTNAKYVRFSFRKEDTDTAQLNEGAYPLEYESFQEYIDPTLIKNAERQGVKEKYVLDREVSGVFRTSAVFESKTDVTRSTDSTAFYAMYDALMAKYPNYITKTLASSDATGKPIYRYDLKPIRPRSSGIPLANPPKFLLITGTHYEKTGVFTLYNTVEQICENWESDELLGALRFNVHFIIIPVLNPWGIDNIISRNSNNVDINQNFSVNWSPTEPDAQHYTGPSPVSEKESKLVESLLITEKPEVMVDFHNFFGTVEDPPDYFLWTSAGSRKIKNIGDAVNRRMTREWQKDVPFISKEVGYHVGITSDAGGGRMAPFADMLGVEYPCVFEVCEKFWMDADGAFNDEKVMKLACEAFINFLLMILSDYSKK